MNEIGCHIQATLPNESGNIWIEFGLELHSTIPANQPTTIRLRD